MRLFVDRFDSTRRFISTSETVRPALHSASLAAARLPC
jgi:hypothetical protein